MPRRESPEGTEPSGYRAPLMHAVRGQGREPRRAPSRRTHMKVKPDLLAAGIPVREAHPMSRKAHSLAPSGSGARSGRTLDRSPYNGGSFETHLPKAGGRTVP